MVVRRKEVWAVTRRRRVLRTTVRPVRAAGDKAVLEGVGRVRPVHQARRVRVVGAEWGMDLRES